MRYPENELFFKLKLCIKEYTKHFQNYFLAILQFKLCDEKFRKLIFSAQCILIYDQNLSQGIKIHTL